MNLTSEEMPENLCPECGKEVTKENVGRHLFGDCFGKFSDGSESVLPIDVEKKVKEIDFFSRMSDYTWLSNFYNCSQTVDGRVYQTNEHYYQSQKAVTPEKEEWIISSKNPGEAKRRGQSLEKNEMKKNWNRIKDNIMLKGLRAKFQNPELHQKLLDTGDAILHEDSPSDTYWGKKGKDVLGKLIMQVRAEIQADVLFG